MKLIYRNLLFVFCILIFNQNAEAQTLKVNGIHLEYQANYIPFSIKYERSILQTEKFRVNAQVGYSHQLIGSSKEFGISGGINLGNQNENFNENENVWDCFGLQVIRKQRLHFCFSFLLSFKIKRTSLHGKPF